MAEALGGAAQSDLVAKADLLAAKSEFKTEIVDLPIELKAEIAGTKTIF